MYCDDECGLVVNQQHASRAQTQFEMKSEVLILYYFFCSPQSRTSLFSCNQIHRRCILKQHTEIFRSKHYLNDHTTLELNPKVYL